MQILGASAAVVVAVVVIVLVIVRQNGPSSTPSTPGGQAGSGLLDSQLVVATGDPTSSALQVVDVSTDQAIRPIPTAGQATKPTLSPDRTTIVYLTGTDRHARVAHRIGVDGSGDRQLFPTDSACAYSTRPAWRSDGQELAVICDDQLWTAGVDGSGLTPVPVDASDAGSLAGSPTWAWVGGREVIVFERRSGADGALNLYWVDPADPTGATAITDTSGANFEPDWSDAGLLFQWNQQSTQEQDGAPFVLKSLDGTPEAIGILGAQNVAWSPSGEQIAYVRVRDQALIVADPDGTNRRQITGLGPVQSLAWGSR